MAAIRAVTLIVAEPGVVAARLATAFGWDVSQDYGRFAEVRAGDGMPLWLNEPSDATIDVQQGVLLHCWVDDVSAATAKARAAGAVILREPTTMDFGMESAWAQVDGGPIVDLTRPTS